MYNAQKTLGELREMGLTKACADLAGAFDYEYSAEISTTDTSDAPALSALVLSSGHRLTEIEKPPLIAAANAVSGMGCVEDCQDISARLSVEFDEKERKKVSEIIEKNEGRIFKSFIE